VTAARPAFAVSDRSGALTHTCCRFGPCYVSLPEGCLSAEMINSSQRSSSQTRAPPAWHLHSRVIGLLTESGQR
jgi:hypothetical protein